MRWLYVNYFNKYYKATLDPLRSGLTPDFEFSYEPHSSVNGFPENFTVNAEILGHSIHTTFYKLDGFIAQASLSSQVLIKNDIYSEIAKLESEKLVILSFWISNFIILIWELILRGFRIINNVPN